MLWNFLGRSSLNCLCVVVLCVVVMCPGAPIVITALPGEPGQAEMTTDQGAIYVTNNRAYTWSAAVLETVDATLNRTVSSGKQEGSEVGRQEGRDSLWHRMQSVCLLGFEGGRHLLHVSAVASYTQGKRLSTFGAILSASLVKLTLHSTPLRHEACP